MKWINSGTYSRALWSIGLSLLSMTALAQPLDWVDRDFKYYANNDSLRDVITNFATNYGVSAAVSGQVSEQISGRFSPDDPEAFLNYLASLYNLTWYYDGAVLYVYKAVETQSKLIQLNQVPVEELRETLESTGIWEERFGWRAITGKGSVYLAGPPRYVQLVTQVAEVLELHESQQVAKNDDFYIEIIPLKYASATDRSISYRDQEIIVPGVATILENILSGVDANIVNQTEGEADLDGETQVKSRFRNGAKVQAEPGLNSIIVRDSRSRLPLYRRLIQQLDKPQRQIEIGLSIIDISVNELEQLGVDWTVGIEAGDNQVIDINTTGDTTGDITLGNGLDFSSVLDKTNLNYLLAQVNLLQQEGSGQIVSRPTLLTQENVQAVLSTSETFYIQLIGEKSQSLEKVTSGMVFKVIPRIVGDRNAARPDINLSLQIEDGSQIPDGAINGVPSTRKTEMSTLATVKQGQSLLIGGVYRDEITQRLRKVPWLGDIPWVGQLFRSQANTKRRTVRLFIVEPRIITQGLGNNIVVGNNQDLRGQMVGIEDISNLNQSFRSALSFYRCQTTEEAVQQQQGLLGDGVSSRRQDCRLPTGEMGARIVPGECDESDLSCFFPAEEAN
ncbi:EscC/YscC/HrcC family type III secretion system outer membrane ring protein [Shewanella psychropiezotolerans]|uniref:Type 3 secretion system secretin n=1 Tax=Shewanella psychropiezotolerans TaxID=2593655 RepID=A0ABX5X4Q4_9GAMM|nr:MULTISPECIES: type III secretion system outer membrane ring subunit SctC [Shewanella]MPY25691.1 EscC/YscC/HrcC family type III secretion system outer membrane ring protein [Shewanella sp. YLB-07]QDO86340.1 EscC/YscC/HrcC family type III secretion system outer membrane ring protein [Shewanella psychropiezotolerans]